MRTPTTDGSVLAQLFDGSAHALRNHVATLRSVAQLQADPEVAAALSASTRAVQVTIERAVALARVELGAGDVREAIDLATLVTMAMRRARREGAPLEDVHHEFAGTTVDVPGPIAERLLADLLHHAGPTPSIVATVQDGEVDIAVALHGDGLPPGVAAVSGVLARACGGRLHSVADEALLTLATGTVSAG